MNKIAVRSCHSCSPKHRTATRWCRRCWVAWRWPRWWRPSTPSPHGCTTRVSVSISFGRSSTTASSENCLRDLVSYRVHTYKNLGVIIDSKPRFNEHIRVVVGKAGGLMNELLRSTVCRNREFMVTLFVSHFRPIIDYCSSYVWNIGYLGVIRLLESLQRRWTVEVVGLGRFQWREHQHILGIYCAR